MKSEKVQESPENTGLFFLCSPMLSDLVCINLSCLELYIVVWLHKDIFG